MVDVSVTGSGASPSFTAVAPWALLVVTVVLPPGLSLVGAVVLAAVVMGKRPYQDSVVRGALFALAALIGNVVLYAGL